MIGRIRQIAAALAALAMTAAPVMSCCAGFTVHAHAAETKSEAPAPPVHTQHPDMAEHCADAQTPPAPDPEEKDSGGCPACAGVELAARDVTPPAGTSVQPVTAPVPATGQVQADFMPALRRTFAPPHGPPAPRATPVELKNTLRL